MEAAGKDREEETLQTAFKKLRVDAERLPGAATGSEVMAPRPTNRVSLEGAKSKLCSPKDTWHCCSRKSSRGASRSQRRRRSKSPILQPPKFTYCSAAMSPPAGGLKHRLSVPEAPRTAADELGGAPAGHGEPCASATPGNISPLLFRSQVKGVVVLPAEITAATPASSPGEARPGEGAGLSETTAEVAEDFRALSELHRRASCSCLAREGEGARGCTCTTRQQGWSGTEVYSFTGLRGVIAECETSSASRDEASRTLSGASSGSPRSCSEQARAYVDDITIEDLSGYMEYYLYIPKKMSHMAEMMYT